MVDFATAGRKTPSHILGSPPWYWPWGPSLIDSVLTDPTSSDTIPRIPLYRYLGDCQWPLVGRPIGRERAKESQNAALCSTEIGIAVSQ